MSDNTPISLEFEFTSLPHPEGSDNKTTLKITPKGALSEKFEISTGTRYDLDETLKYLAPALAITAARYTDRPIDDQVKFTDSSDPNFTLVVNV